MKKLESGLLTNKYTEVWYQDPKEGELAPHDYEVRQADRPLTQEEINAGGYDPTLSIIHFQSGPIKEFGVNGVMNEDLIAMVICRLEHFQKSQFTCRENACAITKLEEALMWLRKRTTEREQRNVIGTHTV
jgi:hypothetical protein